MDFTFGNALRARIAGALAGFEHRGIEDPELRRAAVVIVVAGTGGSATGETGTDSAGEASILLTRRPKTLRRHSGQYALPGGRLEPGEGSLEAGLRELQEELGLTLAESEVLGLLDDFPTRSGFCITPVVAWGGPAADALEPDPGEVAKVFRIPLAELNAPEIPHLDPVPGSEHPVLSAPLPTLGHHLYAPTAALLYQFREVALRGAATRVAHYDQPAFAWK